VTTLPHVKEPAAQRLHGVTATLATVGPRTWLGGIVAVATALRLSGLGAMPLNPYYDAAVRSMGSGWHAFLVGAFDPSAALASDKPPLGLWLQVASTKLLGFTPFALHLPQALASVAAVVLLYDLVRRGFGQRAGLAAAAVLAVLPTEVITARSDTMDSVMMALLVLAAWLVVRAVETGRARELYAAGVVVGLAFETKLFEALLPLPALALLFVLGSRTAWSRRIQQLLVAGAVMACVGLAWPAAFAAIGHASRPYPIGSTNGSIWNTVLVWNGFGRISSGSPSAAAAGAPALLLLVGAALFTAVAVVVGRVARRRAGRLPVALGLALAVWLVVGLGVLGYMRHLSVRYIAPVNPAIAAALGIGIALAARAAARRERGGVMRVGGLIACLAVVVVLTAGSIAIVRARTSDGGGAGSISATELASLSRYLTVHRGHARYEFAAVEAYQAGPLIAADGQPALILASSPYHPLVSTAGLSHAAAAGKVRYVFVSPRGSGSGNAVRFVGGSLRRAPMVAWVRRHGTDVSRSAGLAHTGALYRIDPRTLGGL
jgi:4-amino-4-deoxy-L-arabinose transferase-like glycosyltransferase